MIPKFRAWSKLASRMYIVNGLYFDRGMVQYANNDNAIRFIKLENIILMQSTGLKDKNGKEIFEGDIVDYKGREAIIKWHGSYASFIYRFVDGLKERVLEWDPLFLACYNFEVIGNIYENPELLEVE